MQLVISSSACDHLFPSTERRPRSDPLARDEEGAGNTDQRTALSTPLENSRTSSAGVRRTHVNIGVSRRVYELASV